VDVEVSAQLGDRAVGEQKDVDGAKDL